VCEQLAHSSLFMAGSLTSTSQYANYYTTNPHVTIYTRKPSWRKR